jgi:leucyl-tRNA synthetase
MAEYNPKEIEAKWQKKWLDEAVFRAHDDSAKPKYYQLETFPYPSAAGLHVGHPKGYIAEDIQARFLRMHGREVLYTIGWDAFGLPTENYALKVGRSPKEVAEENTNNFRRQMRMFGFSYDWDREINTSTPTYYRWTQWLFLQLYKKGLAYRANAKVNWCPKDQTVLANEQVINGHCERCGSEIEERDMEQWFFKITTYADRLLDELKGLDWPAATVKRQEDWIGKSEGVEITFSVKGTDEAITVFTTRPDTLFGATYLVLASEHPLLKNLLANIENKKDVEQYIAMASHKTERMRQEEAKEKTGVELKGIHAINPATKEEIPVWVADYVLGSYGTGAIMAVPAHDERDHAFAEKFHLPIKTVIEPETGAPAENEQFRSSIVAVVEDSVTHTFLTLQWGASLGGTLFIGGGREEGEDPVATAKREIQEETGYTNITLVGTTERMHHHYFAFSKGVARQTEVIGLHFVLNGSEQTSQNLQQHEKFTVAWLPKDEILSKMEDENHVLVFRRLVLGEVYTGHGKLTNSGLFDGKDSETAKWEITKAVQGVRKTQYKLRDWSVSRQRYWGAPIPIIYCEKCGIVPVPESDLPVVLPDLADYRPHGMPPLAGSPEFMRATCPKCGAEAKRDPETLDTFVDSSWYYLRYTDPKNESAIFDIKKAAHWLPVDLYVIGAEHTVLHLLYARFIAKFLQDEKYIAFPEPFLKLRHQGLILGADNQKMSKSKGNVVNPDVIVDEFGVDTMRMYEMFMGPFEEGSPWDPRGILGIERFLKRFWKYFEKTAAANEKANVPQPLLHKTIQKVGDDIAAFKFNTAISALMILLNDLEKTAPLSRGDLQSFLKLLHPFAPHMAQELWSSLGETTYLDFEPWPTFDPELIKEEKITLVLQVNGKTRDMVEVASSITEAEAKELALAHDKIKEKVAGQEPKKIIYVAKKLVNIVI